MTKLTIEQSSPKGGASFNDGGASAKNEMRQALQKLKALIESQ